MALPVPNLDDRRFQDLVDDAKRLVQQKCPEWTDHNVSDPGVTLIETFAWMTDQVLYRLNRVPERNYVKFLELIGDREMVLVADESVAADGDYGELGLVCHDQPPRSFGKPAASAATAAAKQSSGAGMPCPSHQALI